MGVSGGEMKKREVLHTSRSGNDAGLFCREMILPLRHMRFRIKKGCLNAVNASSIELADAKLSENITPFPCVPCGNFMVMG